jgi:hypothetical protein
MNEHEKLLTIFLTEGESKPLESCASSYGERFQAPTAQQHTSPARSVRWVWSFYILAKLESQREKVFQRRRRVQYQPGAKRQETGMQKIEGLKARSIIQSHKARPADLFQKMAGATPRKLKTTGDNRNRMQNPKRKEPDLWYGLSALLLIFCYSQRFALGWYGTRLRRFGLA